MNVVSGIDEIEFLGLDVICMLSDRFGTGGELVGFLRIAAPPSIDCDLLGGASELGASL